MEWRETLLLNTLNSIIPSPTIEIMSTSRLLLSASLVVLAIAGCKQPEPDYTTVAVYPSQQQCGVEEKMMSCGEIAAYLRDTLKLRPERLVYVSSVGSDPLPKEDTSLERIAETITAVGFKDVRTANFDVK
jgi:hypothetical protein